MASRALVASPSTKGKVIIFSQLLAAELGYHGNSHVLRSPQPLPQRGHGVPQPTFNRTRTTL